MTLGNLIKEYRSDHAMSQEQFATLSGLSKGYVSMLETGKNPKTGKKLTPSLDVTKKVAAALSMSLNDILAIVEPLDWTDTISKDKPTKDDLEVYESLKNAPELEPIWKTYFPKLRPYLKQMDDKQLKQLVRYARFLLQQEEDSDD